ncbi:MAG TPA: hypothetical protein PLW05_03620, partial [Candidatus Marinimicrobia bacterium]|nr:hypothetical protein [Candidatus Neomarinimicrobiota bacterium]
IILRRKQLNCSSRPVLFDTIFTQKSMCKFMNLEFDKNKKIHQKKALIILLRLIANISLQNA